jgi:hypothetical protein
VTLRSRVASATRVSRRQFVLMSTALLGSAVSTACFGRDTALDQFVAVSAVLTGVARERLDREAGRRYLAAMHPPPAGGLPVEQVAQSGLVGASTARAGADAFRSKGFLDLPAAKITADKIAEYWYRGQVPQAANTRETPAVVTYRSALGWAALTFADAPATCGGAFGFWSNKPNE